MTLAAGLAASLAGAGTAQGQETTLHGQVRPRFESRDPSGLGSDTFTSMRVRFWLESLLDANLSVMIQAQDVRVWGEETSPLFDFNGDNIDVHQAYVRYESTNLDWLTATVGRMETSLGGQRLVGTVDWAQQGQSFDGVRLDLEGDEGSLALMGYAVGDRSAGPTTPDRQLFGAYATRGGMGPGALDVYWLYAKAEAATETDEHSVGARYAFDDGAITGRVEATVQRGSRAGVDVSAFMLGLRAGTSLAEGRAGVTLWYDYLSGDDPTTPEVEVFNTLYATGHKFYGFADLFTNIPAHTGGGGLQDLAAKLALAVRDDVTANIDVHTFRAAERGGLTSSHFGEEIDLTLTHRYSDFLTLSTGFSYVFQGDALAEIGRLSENMKWFYLMFDTSF
jgi:hypothetical protein